MWEYIATAMGAVILLLLSYQIKHQGKLEDKLDKHITGMNNVLNKKLDQNYCDKIRDECTSHRKASFEDTTVKALDDLRKKGERFWDVINLHSHTGLTPESVIIRKDHDKG